MKQIEFNATREEIELIKNIVKRAISLGVETRVVDLQMDIDATHSNGTPLDFQKLIEFDDFNFLHDIYGIMSHIDRNTGELKNCFLPRSAKH